MEDLSGYPDETEPSVVLVSQHIHTGTLRGDCKQKHQFPARRRRFVKLHGTPAPQTRGPRPVSIDATQSCYTYTHTHIYIYIYIYIVIYLFIDLFIYIYIYIHTYIHTYIHAYVHIEIDSNLPRYGCSMLSCIIMVCFSEKQFIVHSYRSSTAKKEASEAQEGAQLGNPRGPTTLRPEDICMEHRSFIHVPIQRFYALLSVSGSKTAVR